MLTILGTIIIFQYGALVPINNKARDVVAFKYVRIILTALPWMSFGATKHFARPNFSGPKLPLLYDYDTQ